MDISSVRVRFAPSPTGFMHLGNVRAALINYLFAKKHNGSFILRIEDTDLQRNIDPLAGQIIKDLQWLHLSYEEGPLVGGPYVPYYQSQRTELYKKYLDTCIAKEFVYRCFCSIEELEKKRARQLALKQPPRYDRCCLRLTQSETEQKLEGKIPFIWRFKLDHAKEVTFFDIARKHMHFALKHFSDLPVTREDGSFTFLFANFIDDVEMNITHIFRGEDHLSNTAVQVALYEAFDKKVPTFWHLPIITNQDGRKLSKRDFGFSLTDLKNEGYLPQAICNYLILMGSSFEHEIMTLPELTSAIDFNKITSTSQIKYDLEKLRWVNHQWIMKTDVNDLAQLCKPYLLEAYPEVSSLPYEKLLDLIKVVHTELVTLKDCVQSLSFFFIEPIHDITVLSAYKLNEYKAALETIIAIMKTSLDIPEESIKKAQEFCKQENLSIKDIFTLLRIALTGKPQGLGIKEILTLLGSKKSLQRLEKLLSIEA